MVFRRILFKIVLEHPQQKNLKWKVTFELTKIKENHALIVTDEGTTGLTGGFLMMTR